VYWGYALFQSQTRSQRQTQRHLQAGGCGQGLQHGLQQGLQHGLQQGLGGQAMLPSTLMPQQIVLPTPEAMQLMPWQISFIPFPQQHGRHPQRLH